MAEPLAPLNVPLPKLPLQLYGMSPSASLFDVHDAVVEWPTVILEGLNEKVQLGGGTLLTVTAAEQVFVPP